MKVTYLEHVELSGSYREFRLEWPEMVNTPELSDGAGSSPAGVRLNFNQRNHLAAFQTTGRSTWIGGKVRLPKDVVTDGEVATLVQSLVDGADALRTVAASDHQCAYPPGVLTVVPGNLREEPPTDLGARIDGQCLPGRAPGLFFARIGDHLIFAADHFHADMISVELLAARVHGAAPGEVGFLETLGDVAVSAADSAPGDKALSVWRRFLRATGGRIPPFPVDLGVGATGPVAPVHDVRRIVDQGDINGVLESRTFAFLLSALAEAVEPLTGVAGFPVVIPVHTRGPRTDPRRRTVGWMVSNAPVIAGAGDPDSTAGWLKDAVTVAELPLETMVETLRPVLPAGTVPMVSYMDFRRSRSPESTTYFSSVSSTDTVQFWFSRRSSGIDLRTKYPDTPQARAAVGRILRNLRARLTETSLPEDPIVSAPRKPDRADVPHRRHVPDPGM